MNRALLRELGIIAKYVADVLLLLGATFSGSVLVSVLLCGVVAGTAVYCRSCVLKRLVNDGQRNLRLSVVIFLLSMVLYGFVAPLSVLFSFYGVVKPVVLILSVAINYFALPFNRIGGWDRFFREQTRG